MTYTVPVGIKTIHKKKLNTHFFKGIFPENKITNVHTESYHHEYFCSYTTIRLTHYLVKYDVIHFKVTCTTSNLSDVNWEQYCVEYQEFMCTTTSYTHFTNTTICSVQTNPYMYFTTLPSICWEKISVLNHKKNRETHLWEIMFDIADSTPRRKSDNIRESLFRQLRSESHVVLWMPSTKTLKISLFFSTLEWTKWT